MFVDEYQRIFLDPSSFSSLGMAMLLLGLAAFLWSRRWECRMNLIHMFPQQVGGALTWFVGVVPIGIVLGPVALLAWLPAAFYLGRASASLLLIGFKSR